VLRKLLVLMGALTAFAVIAAPSLAAKGGSTTTGNSPNAKACQKDGWKALARSTSPTVAFMSETECTGYAAKKGNTIVALETSSGDPVLAACNALGGTLSNPNAEDATERFVYILCSMPVGTEITRAQYDAFQFAPGVEAACAALKERGYDAGSWSHTGFWTGNGFTEPMVQHYTGAKCAGGFE
jgi:hypothetical protein